MLNHLCINLMQCIPAVQVVNCTAGCAGERLQHCDTLVTAALAAATLATSAAAAAAAVRTLST
jgi:hypothetical protein